MSKQEKAADYSAHISEYLKPRVAFQASTSQMQEYQREAEQIRKIRADYDRHEAEMRRLDCANRRKMK